MNVPNVKNWVLVANPNPYPVFYQIVIDGIVRKEGEIQSGATVTPVFPGVVGGPVEVRAWSDEITAEKVIASQRITWGASFEEVKGYPSGPSMNLLSSNYLWTWYDELSTQSRNWVLLINPGSYSVTADVFIGGDLVRRVSLAPYMSQSGEYFSTLTFPGLMDGPVEVRAYRNGGNYLNSSDRRDIFASQRVLWNGNLNETQGYAIP
jgi:hypothetical protein